MKNFFIKIWNACYYFVQDVWNTIVTGSADGKGTGGLNGTGFGLGLFIIILVALVGVIVLLIVLGAKRKRKKKAAKAAAKAASEQQTTAENKPVQVEIKVVAEQKAQESEPAKPAQDTTVIATVDTQPAAEEITLEEVKEEKKPAQEMVVPEGEEARKTQILLTTLKTGREHPLYGGKPADDIKYDDGSVATVIEEPEEEEYEILSVVEEKPEKKKSAKKKADKKPAEKTVEKTVVYAVDDDEKKALKAEIEKLRADKEAEKEARHKAELDSKNAEIERLKKEKETEAAKAAEIARLKAEKEAAEKQAKAEAEQAKKEAEAEKAKAKAEAEKAKREADEKAKAEAEKAKKEAEAEKAKAKAEAEKAKKEADEKAKAAAVAASAAVAAAEKKAKEEVEKAKKEADANKSVDDKKYSGKWSIEKKSDDEFVAKLSALNGEVMLSSEIYSTEKGARNGIATLIKNVTNTGKFEIYQDKNKNYYYKLKNATNRILCVGEIYKTKDQCEKAVESVKRIAANSIIMTELVEASNYVNYEPEAFDENEVMAGVKGKWVIEANAEGKFNAKLYASNGQLMLATEEVSQEDTAKQNVKSVKKNALDGNFVIDKDKFGRFYYKLRNAQKTVICIGESYDNVESCKNAIESVRRFAYNSPITVGAQDEAAATAVVTEKKPAAKKSAAKK